LVFDKNAVPWLVRCVRRTSPPAAEAHRGKPRRGHRVARCFQDAASKMDFECALSSSFARLEKLVVAMVQFSTDSPRVPAAAPATQLAPRHGPNFWPLSRAGVCGMGAPIPAPAALRLGPTWAPGGSRFAPASPRPTPRFDQRTALLPAFCDPCIFLQWIVETLESRMSAGVFHCKVFRGRVFNFLATASS